MKQADTSLYKYRHNSERHAKFVSNPLLVTRCLAFRHCPWVPTACRPPGYRPPGYRPPRYRPPGYRPPGYRPPAAQLTQLPYPEYTYSSNTREYL
eukprot:7380248-Prymnesium_polylepis.2